MRQTIVAIATILGGLAVFAFFIWLTFFITALEQSNTNMLMQISITIITWIAAGILFAAVVYILYLIYRLYTDPNMPLSEISNRKKTGSPEFE